MSEKSVDWHTFTPEQLAAIEAKRAEVLRAGLPERDPRGNYKLVCPACAKPNNDTVSFCTGCSFGLSPADIQRLPDNIFLELVRGHDIGTTVYYRDDDYLVFDDKFGVSDNHLDVIPTVVIDDIKALREEHIPLVERLYALGLAEFRRRNIERFANLDLEQFVSAGFNYPVSVKHLHLHIVLPPFRHNKVFAYPRWHSYKKVLNDLRTLGKVVTYDDAPNEAEGAAEVKRALDNHALCGGAPFAS